MAGELVDIQGMVAIKITTDASGDSTDFSELVVGKTINAVRFVDTDFDSGVDFVITEEETGQAILTVADTASSKTWYPATLLDDVANGNALTTVYSRVSIGHSRIKCVTDEGGDTKSGTIYFLLT